MRTWRMLNLPRSTETSEPLDLKKITHEGDHALSIDELYEPEVKAAWCRYRTAGSWMPPPPESSGDGENVD